MEKQILSSKQRRQVRRIKMKVNWKRIFKPSLYFLEAELEYVKGLLDSQLRRNDELLDIIAKVKTPTKYLAPPSSPIKSKQKGWDAYRETYYAGIAEVEENIKKNTGQDQEK